jgi:hypothetical protein
MKKAALLVFAAMLVFMFCVPVMAMEHQFGGYWRTRFHTRQNFDGTDVEPPSGDWTGVDTRTRLYYTAVFHENLKFVNKFEFDATWGLYEPSDSFGNWRSRNDVAGGQYADIGADGANIEIKNSYADFNIGPLFSQVGVQYFDYARGFLFADDAAGLTIGYQGDGMSIPFTWIKVYEGGTSDNALDVDYYGIKPRFLVNNIEINPYILYLYSENAREYMAGVDELNSWYAGLSVDFQFDPLLVWLTGIYQGGDADFVGGGSQDFEAWLGAIGVDYDFGMGGVHGQFFYATGDDDPNDGDMEAFSVPAGDSYYWAEIMGFGMFDATVPTNAPSDDIENVMAANLGFSVRPMDKLSITLDGWWAQLAEETTNTTDGTPEDDLGVEVDLVITYKLIEGLKLDVVGAYLFAGDAIYNGDDDADPYEIGSRLSLSF